MIETLPGLHSVDDYINDPAVFDQTAVFRSAEPFPHVVIDNFLKPEVAHRLADVFPSFEAPFWYEYANAIERKLACNVWEKFPEEIADALLFLNSGECLRLFARLTGIDHLIADPGLHGGGMHCIKAGGKLDVHLDYSIHPILKLERRLNLIVYLNRGWETAWGGELELWDRQMQHCVKKVAPLFNRAILFSTSDLSYHGHPEPLRTPDGVCRKSLAVYYLTEPREGATDRFRARFVARPQDPKDPEIERLRELRSGLATGTQVYREESQQETDKQS